MDEGQALLKIDLTDAFNAQGRDVEISELYPFIHSCYSGQSFLRFGQSTLLSDESP